MFSGLPDTTRSRRRKPRKRGVEERTLADGSWERVFHGKSIDDPLCRNALKETAEQSIQKHLDGERVRVKPKGSTHALIERERAELYERQGKLETTGQRFVGIGDGKRGCDRCGESIGPLRYIEGAGWLCKRKCLEEVQACLS